MDNALFLGNGLFRLKTECEKQIGCEGRDKSWGDLLSEIAFAAQDTFNNNLPMPIEYDRILASIERKRDALEDYYGVDGRNDLWKQILSEDDLSRAVKRYIAGWFNERSCCFPEVLELALGHQFDYVLTSNYDLRIENFCSGVSRHMSKHRASDDNGGSCFENTSPVVFHVHGSIDDAVGSADESKRFVIGQGDYIESAHKITRVIDDWDGALSGGRDDWPQLFLGTNVFILGFSFGLDEIDLWHLLHLRAAWFAFHSEFERNRICYFNLYASGGNSLKVSDPARYELFGAYDVEVIDVPVLHGDYEGAYLSAIGLIADRMPYAQHVRESVREAARETPGEE